MIRAAKQNLRFWMPCKAQTAAIAGLLRGFATQQSAKIREFLWREELFSLSLPIEDLLTDKGRFKLDASLTYANAEQHGVATGQPIVVQTGPTAFITLPTLIGERSGNTDTLVSTLGLRYGLNDKSEIYARASHFAS